jgi:hypothetical protein
MSTKYEANEQETSYWLKWIRDLKYISKKFLTEEEKEINNFISNAKDVFSETDPLQQMKYYIIKAEDKEQLFVRLNWNDIPDTINLSYVRVNPEMDKKEKAYESLAKLFESIYGECKDKNKLFIKAKPISKKSKNVLIKLSSPRILPKGYELSATNSIFVFKIL